MSLTFMAFYGVFRPTIWIWNLTIPMFAHGALRLNVSL